MLAAGFGADDFCLPSLFTALTSPPEDCTMRPFLTSDSSLLFPPLKACKPPLLYIPVPRTFAAHDPHFLFIMVSPFLPSFFSPSFSTSRLQTGFFLKRRVLKLHERPRLIPFSPASRGSPEYIPRYVFLIFCSRFDMPLQPHGILDFFFGSPHASGPISPLISLLIPSLLPFAR